MTITLPSETTVELPDLEAIDHLVERNEGLIEIIKADNSFLRTVRKRFEPIKPRVKPAEKTPEK